MTVMYRRRIQLLAFTAVFAVCISACGSRAHAECKDEHIAASASARGNSAATGDAVRKWEAEVRKRFGRVRAEYGNARKKHVPFACKPLTSRPGFASCAVRAAPCKL
jgi:hypothetical protein